MRFNTRLARAKLGLERRMFLKALAVGLSVPIAAKLARLATAQETAAPKRLMVMFVPHGTAPEHFGPRVMGNDLTNFVLNETEFSILGPLETYKQYVNVYEGFEYPGSAETHSGNVNVLSGAPTTDDTTPRTSMERVIANALGVRPLILGACAHLPYGLDKNGKLFWDGTAVDPEKDPSTVADAIFGTSDSPAPEVDVNVELRSELLGLTATEIEGLSSDLSGLTKEQSKLQTHLAAIQNLKNGQGAGTGVSACTTRPNLPAVEAVRAASAGQVIDPSGGNDYFYQEANFEAILDAQLELSAQALICNAAQVIGLQPMYVTCEFDFGFAGAAGSHHNGLSHTGPQQADGVQYNTPPSIDNAKPDVRAKFATAQRWFTQKLVDNVVSVLATTDDPFAPGTKVLDNTIIYMFSEIADGADHGRTSAVPYYRVPTSLPLVTIGGGGGALKTGQVVRYALPDTQLQVTGEVRPAVDIYRTLAQAMGAGDVTFPGSTGVLDEVLL